MTWLLIDNNSGTVWGTSPVPPLPGQVRGPQFTVKEWDGPALCGDPDPTLNDPDYDVRMAMRKQARFDATDLLGKIDNELDWLGEVIPQVDTMSLEELRGVLKRLARESEYQIKAWRYVLTHLDHFDREHKSTC